MFVAAYLLSDASRGETNRAIGVLTSGDIEVVRDYLLSYGAWTALISATLMALQAILALLPSFILDFANGLPSVHSRAHCGAS